VEPRWRALVLVSGFGGLRWGECVGLRRRHVDLLHRTVTVVEQVTEVDGRLEVGPPKTEAGRRVVVLPRVAADALADHLANWSAPSPDGLVFPASEGGYLRRTNWRQRAWLPATKATGCEGVRFHDLRHAAATLAATTGASTRELMTRLGHASPVAALRYQHVAKGRDAAIARGIDQLVRKADRQPSAPVLEVGSVTPRSRRGTAAGAA
ncbi:MAG TPA: tyrosine-type recombinase/integrase, partial [Acidimicrobiales bacterium]|nr:tyrosine-type recombinase/integrase [Acidimicrobiales bacterium]